MKVDRAFQVKDIAKSLERSQFSYDYEKIELDQLMQMYKADDLTDVTEEMILKRQKRSVERAAYGLEKAKISNARQVKFSIPERDRSKRESLTRAGLKFSKYKLDLRSEMSSLEANYQNQVVEVAKVIRWENFMKADRKQLTQIADRDGVVYYGDVRGGKFDKNSNKETLKVGGYGVKNRVLMTVVSKGDFLIKIDLNEKQMNQIKVGMKGEAVSKDYKKEKMNVEVLSVASFEKTAGKFAAVLKVSAVKGGKVRVGMSCDVTFKLD